MSHRETILVLDKIFTYDLSTHQVGATGSPTTEILIDTCTARPFTHIGTIFRLHIRMVLDCVKWGHGTVSGDKYWDPVSFTTLCCGTLLK